MRGASGPAAVDRCAVWFSGEEAGGGFAATAGAFVWGRVSADTARSVAPVLHSKQIISSPHHHGARSWATLDRCVESPRMSVPACHDGCCPLPLEKGEINGSGTWSPTLSVSAAPPKPHHQGGKRRVSTAFAHRRFGMEAGLDMIVSAIRCCCPWLRAAKRPGTTV